MVRSFTLVFIAALTLLSAPDVFARGKPRGDGRRCTRDAQCLSGYCCDGVCSTEAACCGRFAGEVPCDVDLCCNTLIGEACCYQEPYGFRCADTGSENNNCGACGNECPNGQICRNGTCGCPDGLTLCNGYCVDTDTDMDNCGTCGHACQSGSCTNGACECPAGQTDCNGACRDLQGDPNNCGACGNVCPAEQECIFGSCEELCPPCEVFQNGACVPKDCGACATCDATTGQCTSTCGAGQLCCGGTCVPSAPGGGGHCCEWQGSWHVCPTDSECAGVTCCGPGYSFCGDGNNPQCCADFAVCQGDRCCIPDGVSGCPCPPGVSCPGCCSYGQ